MRIYRVAVALGVIFVAGLRVDAQQAASAGFSWAQPHAKVLPTGGLEWAPRPFEYKPGTSIRYIDFDGGDDANSGDSKDKPWKHHPWDSAATGKAKDAKGIDTYVFKGEVIYRGQLMARESGQAGSPIQLTCDPAWGNGPARVYGSQRIAGGWKKCAPADAPGIPQPEKVWFVDIGNRLDPKKFRLSALWQIDGDKVQRVNIARDPNWSITDPDNPMAGWYKWETFTGFQNSGTLADKKNLAGKPAGFFDDAWAWTEHRHLMGTVHRTALKDYNPAEGSFKVSSPGGASFYPTGTKTPAKLDDRVHYYIENVRGYLDTAGEYFFDRDKAHPGRLYLRPADGVDPNTLAFEASKIKSPVEIRDQSNIVISGITFSFNDDYDGKYGYPWYIGYAPAVRVVGTCDNITVRNCRFYDVMNAVVAFPRPTGTGGSADAWSGHLGKFNNDVMDNIFITDNDVRNADEAGAIAVVGNSDDEPFGRLKHVEVLRNRIVNAGFRPGPAPTSQIPAIDVTLPETAEIAGNIVDTSWGSGIFTKGGKNSGSANDAPLSRILIHHNQVENTMLGCNDYGALEMFQGGPGYFYNNVAHNTVGTRTFTGGELGYTLYLDGGFKIYSFNNILSGKTKSDPKYYNHCGYFMVFGFMDHLFNNTIHRFEYGMNGSSGNRSCVLGNVVTNCSKGFLVQNRAGDVSMMFGGDTGEQGRVGIATMVYGNNVFYGSAKGRKNEPVFGEVGGTAQGGGGGSSRAQTIKGATIDELRAALEKMQARVSSIGEHVKDMPLARPDQRDFRLAKDSAARDKGVKFFAPWGLYGMVGEWNFCRNPASPTTVLGENFYMTEEFRSRDMYYHIPRNDLTVSQCTLADYEAGPLEDWIEGALKFDGKRFATLTHADMTRDMDYPAGRKAEKSSFKGADRKTVDMGVNSFLVEVYFKTDAGHTGGMICGKQTDDAGYDLIVDNAGSLQFRLHSGTQKVAFGTPMKLNDGQWHHVIAELDRPRRSVRFYVDGTKVLDDKPITLDAAASLANTGDFVVGKEFVGAIDFLRVSRGTLADAKTTIEELYAWQFDGPFLKDFCGNAPVGKRDAGAIESR